MSAKFEEFNNETGLSENGSEVLRGGSMGRKNADSSKRRTPKHVEASITLVEHGYQIDVRDYTQSPDDKTGVLVSTSCRDFGGNYDIVEMAKTLTAVLLGVMAQLEDHHKKVLHLRALSTLPSVESELEPLPAKRSEDDLRRS